MRKNLVKMIAGITIAGLLTGCSSGQIAEPKTQANMQGTGEAESIIFGDTQAPSNLDIAESWNSWYTSRYGITETLYKLDD